MVPVKPIGLNGLQDCCFFFFSGSPFCRTRQRASGGPAGAHDAGRAAAARGQEGSAELGLLSPGQASADSTSQAPALIFVVLQILPRDFEAKQLLFVFLFLGSFKKKLFSVRRRFPGSLRDPFLGRLGSICSGVSYSEPLGPIREGGREAARTGHLARINRI